MNKCYFCDSINTQYCSLCGHYFCDICRSKYDKRIIAMIKEKFKKIGLQWLTKEEYDNRKKEQSNS